MKDIKTGDDHYKGKNLKKVTVWMDEQTERLYERKRKQLTKKQKHKWSKREFYSYWFSLKAPKG